MILFIHHRYRVPGGEERVVEDLAWLVRTELGEDAKVLTRSSAALRPAAAAAGLLSGGLRPEQIAEAVRHTGARIVHAHNLQPTLGWRALAAARAAGARVVLHLHQYRLVCAIGVCFRDGHECLECHGRDTAPGVRHNCRGSRAEALAYGAGLALWQRRMLAHADAVVVPSAFALARLRALGIELPEAHIVGGVVRAFAEPDAVAEPGSPSPHPGRRNRGGRDRHGALVVSRLAPEKGVDLAIDACARAEIPLTIAGDGPERGTLQARAERCGADVRFLGRVDPPGLPALRAGAAIAIVASRSAETFGLAAAEAMAAGLPVAATRVGALPELVPDAWLAPPDDVDALAAVLHELTTTDPAASRALALRRAREHASPRVVAAALRDAYAAAVDTVTPDTGTI